MKAAPSFWWQPQPSPAGMALWPIGRLWGAAASWRMAREPGYRAPVPVICVGNFVVGGAGKTPTALALAKIARARGMKLGFLSSGYGGSAAGPLLVDPSIYGPDQVGDEALLLASVAPTVIGSDRGAGARKLVAEGVDLIVMDDGFQNPSLAKDVSFIAVDAAAGIGNGLMIPAGPLRAPLKVQLGRADFLVVIGSGEAADPLIRAAARAGRSTVRARLRAVRMKDWRRERFLAFAGIGRPAKFFATLSETKAEVVKTYPFPDHHRYSEADAEMLLAAADAGDLRLVTTEKDMARLAGKGGAVGRLRERTEAFPVILEFENPGVIAEIISDTVRDVSLRARN